MIWHLLPVLLAIVVFYAGSNAVLAKSESTTDKRPRVIILSDFPPLDVIPGGAGHGPAEKRSDPDDLQSMVRFLVYANDFDVEALVASSGTLANIANKQNLLDILDLYDKVDENLRRHDSRYPTTDRLRSVTFQGRSGSWGKPVEEILGEGKDSDASEAILRIVDKPDPRPVWVCAWGGPCEVAQAIWKVQKTRSSAELDQFLSKLRIFMIGLGDKTGQDGSGQWMLDHFPNLFVIVSQKTYGGMFAQAFPIANLEWLNANIRAGHGPLGAVYPPTGYNPDNPGMQEGDTPSFMYLYSAVLGINDPDKPDQESWGGQYQQRDPSRNHWFDGPGPTSVVKWLPEIQKDFATRADWMLSSHASSLKPRMIVLTDISPINHEPDDMESMIRLLVHADLFEIEGLVATTGWSYEQVTLDNLNLIHRVINAYEKDLPNLLKRSGQAGFLSDESRQEIGYWPSPDYLRSRTVMGSKIRGQSHIGEGNDSAGSNLIIQCADEDDDRPVWVQAWGGGNTLAQAIWRVREKQTQDEFKDFLHKIRLYTITDQDRDYKSGTPFDISSHQWMRREFEKDLFFIWDECAWKFQNGTGKSNWDEYVTHIQRHGNLGEMYPKYKYGVEGDTPAFLYIMPIGLNDPDVPGQGSWGGYFEWGKGPDNQTYAYTNHQTPAYSICQELEKRFYQATFNNFAARMDWAKEGAGNRNPVVVVNGDSGLACIRIIPVQGTSVTLDASGSHDPDGDKLAFSWWVFTKAGTHAQDIAISGADSNRVTVQVPSDSAGKSFHVICEVTDNGTPALTAYRRIIFEPTGLAPNN